MATYSNILAWRIPMERGAWWAAVHGGHKESDTTERLSTGLRYGDLFILMNIFQEFSWLVKKKVNRSIIY